MSARPSSDLPSPGKTTPPPTVKSRAAGNVFWLLAERILKAFGGVGMGIVIARHLGPDLYGAYGAAIGMSTLAKEAVMMGYDRMIRRDLTARPKDAGQIIGSSIGLGLMVAFATVLTLTAFSHRLADEETTRRLVLIAIWMALPQAFFACEIWFESAGRTKPLVWTRNAVWTLSIAGRLVLVFTDASVTAFAILALAEWAITYAAVVWLLQRLHGDEFRYSYRGDQVRAWFTEGWPVLIMTVFNSAADRLMVLVVQNLATDSAEAGYLNAAARITDIWWSISTIVAAVLLPRIVMLKLTDPARHDRAVQAYANASFLVGTGAALAVTITAPFLIPALFGAAYTPSALVLVILVWSGPATFPSVARSQLWVSEGRQVFDLPSVIVTALFQLGLSFLLIPRYGAIGAAFAMTGARWIGFYGVTAVVPALRRASQPQFLAFRSLVAPLETYRSLSSFLGGMLKRS